MDAFFAKLKARWAALPEKNRKIAIIGGIFVCIILFALIAR